MSPGRAGTNPAAGVVYPVSAPTLSSTPLTTAPMLETLQQERYAPAAHRLEAIDALVEALSGAERVVLTTHLNADGDGVGSEVALLEFLAHRGVAARIVNPTPFPDLFRFLLPEVPGAEEGGEGAHPLVLEASTPEARAWCAGADLVVVLDTGEVPRIGRVKPMVEHLPHRVVDHHPPGDRPIEGPAYRDVEASATGELVFDLVHRAGGPWTRALVEGLYTAILTDTGSFRFSNATPRAHRVAAELIARGASPDDLHTRVYGMAPLRRYRLLEAALPSLDRSPDGKVSWMTVPSDAYRRLGCDPADLEGLTDYPRTLAGTEVALLFRAVDDGIKISFRANGEVDVNRIARELGGGGHVRASGALVQGDLEKVRLRVVELVKSVVAGEAG